MENSHPSLGSLQESDELSSTLAGETLVLTDSIDNGMCLSALYSEITRRDSTLSNLKICVTDNYSLLDAVKSTKSVTEKRLCLEVSNLLTV